MRHLHQGDDCDVIPNWFSFLFTFQSDTVKYKLLAKAVDQEEDRIKFIDTHLAGIHEVYDMEREGREKAERGEGCKKEDRL